MPFTSTHPNVGQVFSAKHDAGVKDVTLLAHSRFDAEEEWVSRNVFRHVLTSRLLSVSQACELHVAGYKFSVLSSAFVVHRGFKIQGEFHPRKDEENKRNRVLFRSFKEALKTKYPSSDRRC